MMDEGEGGGPPLQPPIHLPLPSGVFLGDMQRFVKCGHDPARAAVARVGSTQLLNLNRDRPGAVVRIAGQACENRLLRALENPLQRGCTPAASGWLGGNAGSLAAKGWVFCTACARLPPAAGYTLVKPAAPGWGWPPAAGGPLGKP